MHCYVYLSGYMYVCLFVSSSKHDNQLKDMAPKLVLNYCKRSTFLQSIGEHHIRSLWPALVNPHNARPAKLYVQLASSLYIYIKILTIHANKYIYTAYKVNTCINGTLKHTERERDTFKAEWCGITF